MRPWGTESSEPGKRGLGGLTREEHASLLILASIAPCIPGTARTEHEVRAQLIEIANKLAREWCASRDPGEGA